MGCCLKFIVGLNISAFAGLGLFLVAIYQGIYPFQKDVHPVEKVWFGKGDRPIKEDTSIKPFKINIGDNELKDLKARIERDLPRLKGNHPGPIVNSFRYGTNLNFLTEQLAVHWLKKYDWRKQEKMLNGMGSHHKTNIDGLDVHFVVAKPDAKLAKGKRVLPLLLVHGWPGSFVEFAKIIPLLTTPKPDSDLVFEVVVPSIPGYGFSSPPQKPGFHQGQCARVFWTLMNRLGHKKFYTQGGDWGAVITVSMATMYPKSVLGTHLNMVVLDSPSSMLRGLGASLFPKMFLENYEEQYILPLMDTFAHFIVETGYFHIQSSRPDTVGVGLNTSPLGLASYIIEKFATFTSPKSGNADAADGNLLKMFTMDELINNIMIYWWTGSITSSMRFYKENFGNTDNPLYLNPLNQDEHVQVPVGVAMCLNELIVLSKSQAETKFKNLVSFNAIPKAGHFAAYEEPDALANDFIKFAEIVEKQLKSKPKAADNKEL